MKPHCKNHPNKTAIVRGLCQACYMRGRRAARKLPGEYTHARTPTGETVAKAVAIWSPDLSGKFYGHTDATAGADACHEWHGTKTRGGYGMITLGGYNVLAHRMAHALATGETGAEVVMHECDNPSCVNPRHLRGGTHLQNSADMLAKGRGAKPGQLGHHLRRRDTHPRAKPVQTPSGAFPSAALAAVALGLHPRSVSRYCRQGLPGWAYRD